MRKEIVLLAALAAGTTGCAGNSTVEQGATADQIAASGEEPKLICERVKTTGTRFTEKVCMTEEQWEATRSATQDGGANTTREWQRRGKMANDRAPTGG
jgi:hypothetical protein